MVGVNQMKKPFPLSTVKSISKNDLTANEKWVLSLLMDWQESCEVFISAATLAEQASLGEATIKRVFKSLSEKEILTLKRVRRGQKFIYIKELDFDKIKSLATQPQFKKQTNNQEMDFSIPEDFHI